MQSHNENKNHAGVGRPVRAWLWRAAIAAWLWTGSSLGASALDLNAIDELDLETACRMALRGNPSLRAAGQRIEQARARLSLARSRYWPRLSLSAGASQVDQRVATYQPALGIGNPETFYQAGAQASWVLFDGFSRRFENALARWGRAEAEAAHREGRRLILSSVTEAFLNALLADENAAIAQSDQAFNERLLKEAEARRRAGAGSLGDELSFRVRANAARSSAISARSNYRVALVGLAVLMGLPEGELPPAVRIRKLDRTETDTGPEANFEALLHEAEAERPDIEQARAALERSRAARGAARAAYYPSVVLTGALNGERAEDTGFTGDDFGSVVGLGLSVDLFDGGARRAGLCESRAVEEEAVARLEGVRLSVAGEIRAALANLQAARESLELQNANAAWALENRDLAEKEYRGGQAALVRVNEAQRDLSTALARQAQAFIAVYLARNDLRTSTGAILNDYAD